MKEIREMKGERRGRTSRSKGYPNGRDSDDPQDVPRGDGPQHRPIINIIQSPLFYLFQTQRNQFLHSYIVIAIGRLHSLSPSRSFFIMEDHFKVGETKIVILFILF